MYQYFKNQIQARTCRSEIKLLKICYDNKISSIMLMYIDQHL